MKTKILVTGANGQLGKTIKDLYSKDLNLNIKFTSKSELEITNNEEVSSFFKDNKFDYCINCAAYTNVEEAESNAKAAFKVNADAVMNLAVACKANNVVLIHISTDYVFDGEKQTPYTEEDIPNPINEYGKSKLAGERYIQEIKPNYFIIRASWLYSRFGNNFLKSITGKIQNQERLTITTSQKGTPTSCDDLSEFILMLIKSKNSNFGIYHFSAQGETTWFDYALQICKHFRDYDCNKIEPVEIYNAKARRPKYSVLDCNKIMPIINEQIFWKKSVDKTVLQLIET